MSACQGCAAKDAEIARLIQEKKELQERLYETLNPALAATKRGGTGPSPSLSAAVGGGPTIETGRDGKSYVRLGDRFVPLDRYMALMEESPIVAITGDGTPVTHGEVVDVTNQIDEMMNGG